MSEEERDYENEARQQGWKPQEDYEGDPERWVDAQTFVERGEQFVGLLKPKLDKLEKQLRYQESVNKDMKKYVKEFQSAKQKEIEQLETKLKEQRKQAVAAGDGEAFERAETELQNLQDQKKGMAPPKEAQPEPPEWAQDWLSENQWYEKDPVLRRFADAYSDELRTLNPSLTEREFLDSVSEHVKAEMPHKFTNSRKSPDVEGSGGRRSEPEGNSNAQTYNNLPAEAKATAKRLINEGIIKDKEEYARLYYEQ